MKACVVSILIFLLLPGLTRAQERDEQVLAWDDGGDVSAWTAPAPCDLREMAVRFEAPEGLTWLREILCYVCNDQVQDPYDPQAPTTGPCTLAVWGPEEVGGVTTPGSTVYWFVFPGGYPEESWITFILSDAVDLSDSATFPDGVFFVGMKWLERLNPIPLVDRDPMQSGNTWQKCPDEWERSWEFSAAIRAVVSDKSGTLVEPTSWGRVKSGLGAR